MFISSYSYLETTSANRRPNSVSVVPQHKLILKQICLDSLPSTNLKNPQNKKFACGFDNTEAMIPRCLPDLPWQKVGIDLFDCKMVTYLIIVEFYSRFVEGAKLERMTAEKVVLHCKSIFARHGIPELVITDKRPQFEANELCTFFREFQFEHITSSSYHPLSNAEAERAVKTMKSLLKKGGDPYLALLAYR